MVDIYPHGVLGQRKLNRGRHWAFGLECQITIMTTKTNAKQTYSARSTQRKLKFIRPMSSATAAKKLSRASCSGASCTDAPEGGHPDHRAVLSRLNRVQGQIAGISNMIESRRYCTDILTQFSAVHAALRSTERSILEKHLRGCVQEAIHSANGQEVEDKINEILKLVLTH